MTTDPAIGFDADPNEQREGEVQQIEDKEAGRSDKVDEPREGSDATSDDANADAATKSGDENSGLASGEEDSGETSDNQYDPDARKSVVVPGTDGTLSGTAFADMVDDEGNLKDDAIQVDEQKLDEIKKEYDDAMEANRQAREEKEEEAKEKGVEAQQKGLGSRKDDETPDVDEDHTQEPPD